MLCRNKPMQSCMLCWHIKSQRNRNSIKPQRGISKTGIGEKEMELPTPGALNSTFIGCQGQAVDYAKSVGFIFKHITLKVTDTNARYTCP